MNNSCTHRKDQLLEAALAETMAPELATHLLACAACAQELSALRARRERLDALLPFVVQDAEPSPDFRMRVLAAAETASYAGRAPYWRTWGLAGAAAVVLAALLLAIILRSRISAPVAEPELLAAQKLAEWRAPSDIFLQTPGSEILRTTPKLGGSFLPIPSRSPEPHKEK
jgi:anti-sigma factor RsiW